LHTMPIELQAKLLRVLEDGMVRRVGSSQNIAADVRVIAAMNVHPIIALQEQKLRNDLYYRLNVFTFSLLPLRERREDIMFLTNHYIQEYNHKLQKAIRGVRGTLERFFMDYSWPGNVRELKHTIEYMMNVCEREWLEVADLPIMLRNSSVTFKASTDPPKHLSFRKNLEDFEKTLILEALELSKGNVNQAAKLLDIPRQTLQYKMKKILP